MPTPIRYTTLPKVWPGRQRPAGFTRKRSPFKVVTWSPVERLLETELRHLGAKDVTIAVDIRNPFHFRNDGGLRSDARPATPGVILSLTRRDGVKLTFPCDTYGDWTTNVYAIARSLEMLRAVDRYGVTQGDQQYVGFKALGAGTPAGMTDEDAAQILAAHSPFPAQLILAESSVADVETHAAPLTDGAEVVNPMSLSDEYGCSEGVGATGHAGRNCESGSTQPANQGANSEGSSERNPWPDPRNRSAPRRQDVDSETTVPSASVLSIDDVRTLYGDHPAQTLRFMAELLRRDGRIRIPKLLELIAERVAVADVEPAAEAPDDDERESMCVVCGCTDLVACQPGCFWLVVDRESHRGVCSSCAADEGCARLLLAGAVPARTGA